jgi:hypothetical protein
MEDGDFVKGMRDGSGRNLHPMLITPLSAPDHQSTS